MNKTPNTPNLEERFLEPKGWRWHSFKCDGRTLRFGSVFPEDSIPDAVVVCLPGLSEFCEKYFEVAREMLAHNYAFWVFDWMGQGKSDRYLPNPHKRHSNGFQQDVDDLHDFILGYIKHSSVHTDKGRIPLAMLAHSMGSNIGAHYLHQHPDIFECAAFTAPMFGIKAFKKVPLFLQLLITGAAKKLARESYVRGSGDWSEEIRVVSGDNQFSSDEKRGAVHNSWCTADPELQVGNITYGWLYHAIKSCAQLPLKSIQTHCLLASASKEDIVDNKAIVKAAKLLPNAKHICLSESRHEILMERDDIRDEFFTAFHQLIKETIIDRPETLKPF